MLDIYIYSRIWAVLTAILSLIIAALIVFIDFNPSAKLNLANNWCLIMYSLFWVFKVDFKRKIK